MRKDPTEFRKRFAAYKAGKMPYRDGKIVDWEEDTDYGIPFDESKRVRLTDAGYATGAVLSTNMLDSIADNAIKAGLPIRTAMGLAVKESTLGNPTDDRSARTLLSAKNKALWANAGYGLHINEYGDYVSARDLINWWKDLEDARYGKSGRSALEGGFEFYKNNPRKYNPGQPNHPQLVEKRAKELMKSPLIQLWQKNRSQNQVQQLKAKNFNEHWLKRYEDGKTPMLDRLEFDDGTKYLQWEKDFLDKYWSSEEQKRLGLDPKKEATKSMLYGNTVFNAGTLPGVVIKPPKDSKKVLSEAKEMLPIDKMRHNWYNNIDQIRDGFYPANNIDPYEYIRRMYNIYETSDKPRVSTTRVPEYTILHNPFDISGKEREMYDPILNTMYLNPDRPSFIDEMSHAFQFNTDVPGDNYFLPGDWEINGKSGYERPGHAEYTAHKIIQPTLKHYLENQDTDFPIDDIIKVVTDMHNNPKDWGYPTREEVMNGRRSGRIGIGPKKRLVKILQSK